MEGLGALGAAGGVLRGCDKGWGAPVCWAGSRAQLASQGVQGSRTGGLTLVSGCQEKGGVSGDGEGLEDPTHSLENSLEQG